MDRRLIEETFPVREVSQESAKEKGIRMGHISTLHIWWARRPLASSRTTNYACLVPSPNDVAEQRRKRDFIIKLSKWENSSNYEILEKARKDILGANDGKPPKVLDPFAGGGAIPLEAARLGCETYAGDYNPVAVLILKCMLEYTQKYAGDRKKTETGLLSDKAKNKLLEDVKRWNTWVVGEAKKEIAKFYPGENDGFVPVGYVWTRTIPCQNPTCNSEIPLVRQYWLSKKKNKKVSLYPVVSKGRVEFRIVGTGYEKNIPKNFDPTNGTIARSVVTCLVCGSVVSDTTTRKLFSEAKSSEKLVAVVLHKEGITGKRYRIANNDTKLFLEAEKFLEKKRKQLMDNWGLDPIPDEEFENIKGRFNIYSYGMRKWGDLFNSRQKLAVITFVEKVREAHEKMLTEGMDGEYAKAITTYLALAVDMTAAFNNKLARWENTSEAIKQLYSRQSLPMLWDYVELNPFSRSSGSFETGLKYYLKVIEHCSQIMLPSIKIRQLSATSLPYPENYFDAVISDPPYYDNVPYSDLSDFFYVWLKRTIGALYPDLFSTPLTPKTEECTQLSNLCEKYSFKTKEFFEKMLTKAFQEMYRVLKQNGIACIVFAHKSTEAWETIINSLLESGLVVTSAWPIHTEMKERLIAKESAALASSIYMVARKLSREETGFYREVRGELKKHLDNKLSKLWNEGISGADFFISAIGSSIEVFGKYEKIIDDEGNLIRANRLLDEVRRIVTDYAVRQVLHNGFAGEISELTRFYVLWRWAYGDKNVHFDDARKLAQSVGIDLVHEWNKGFIQKDKEFIYVLGPEERKAQELNDSKELVDVLHNVLLLWKKGKRDDIVKILKETGFGRSDIFYRVAQAISETLPNSSKEKKLLEGFLSGREKISEDIRKQVGQTRLFE